MKIIDLTDQDIEDLCRGKPYGDKMRDDLWAQRFEARYEAMREAALENRFAAVEEEMTDASKADDFSPNACRFPTEAQLEIARKKQEEQSRQQQYARREGMVGVSIAVSTDRMCGKTSLLLMILDMLADAGALSAADTRFLTNNGERFFHYKRCINEDNVEVLDLDLDLNVLYEMSRR